MTEEKEISEYVKRLNEFAKQNGLDVTFYYNGKNYLNNHIELEIAIQNPTQMSTEKDNYIYASFGSQDNEKKGTLILREVNGKAVIFLGPRHPTDGIGITA